MARYSASAVERVQRETIVCFFIFHEMGLVPSKTNTKYIDAITMNLEKILTA